MKKLFSLLILFITFSINAQIITNVDKLRINEITEMQEAGKILVVDSNNVVQWISPNLFVNGFWKGADNPSQVDLENEDNWSKYEKLV